MFTDLNIDSTQFNPCTELLLNELNFLGIKLILFYQYSPSQSIIAYPYECLLNNDFRYSIEVFTFDSINNYFGDTEILQTSFYFKIIKI